MEILSQTLICASQQYRNYLNYNQWLKGNCMHFAIPEKEMDELKKFLSRVDDDDLIFYWHSSPRPQIPRAYDCMCTIGVALRFLHWQNLPILLPLGVSVNKDFFRLRDAQASARQGGFYIRKFPPQDRHCIGKKFHAIPPARVIDALSQTGDIGIGSEMFQYLAILNPGYYSLMDAHDFLNVALPALEVSSRGDGIFNKIPAIDFYQGKLHLVFLDPSDCGASSGSGTLLCA